MVSLIRALRGLLLFAALSLSAGLAAEIVVVDGSGARVELAQPALRIVSMSPHLTELLFAVGAGPQIVATVDYSNYPPAALDIPRIGSNNAISYESIVGLSPDLVLAWQSGNGGEMIARLKSLGLQVYVDEPGSLHSIAQTLAQLGRLAGREQEGLEAANRYRRKLEQLRDRYSQRPPLSVFYQVWDDPLLSLNGEHVISEVIELCGGRNVFATALPLVPKLSIESVIAVNPQVIIASGEEEQRLRWLEGWRAWPMLGAVQRERLYFVPASLLQRHSPRILEGADLLCQQLEAGRGQ